MQYLLLMYANEADWDSMPGDTSSAMIAEFGAFTQGIIASGHYKGGNRLDLVSKATTVRVRDGKRSVTDGPFAETKEQLGGYYLVEAADLDEAIELAGRIPGARIGSVEIRPVPPMGPPPA